MHDVHATPTLHATHTLDMIHDWPQGASLVATRGFRGGIACTKQVYHASLEPAIYIMPAQSILGRLAPVPVGEHGTIPSSLSANSSSLKRGKCDEQGRQGRPGTGSKLFYINSWAMIWPPDHPLLRKGGDYN